MLTGPEIDIVEMQVSTLEDADLVAKKELFISKGETAGSQMEAMMVMGGDHSLYEKEMHIAAEFLVFIDQRLEGKDSWFFRFRRRLKYVNQFRPKYR